LADHLLGPLALTHTQTLPERMIRYAVAHGHDVGDGGAVTQVQRWAIPRSSGPAGIIAARARDVCVFARLHLDHGRSPAGGQLLSEQSVRAMQKEEAVAPAFGRRARAGLCSTGVSPGTGTTGAPTDSWRSYAWIPSVTLRWFS